MLEFLKTHATRFYALAVALLALATHYLPSLPEGLILGVIAAGLGLGEGVQRVEDKKHAPTHVHRKATHDE